MKSRSCVKKRARPRPGSSDMHAPAYTMTSAPIPVISSAKRSENPSRRSVRSTPGEGAHDTRPVTVRPASISGARLTNAAKRPAGTSARSQPDARRAIRSASREIGPGAQLPSNDGARRREIITDSRGLHLSHRVVESHENVETAPFRCGLALTGPTKNWGNLDHRAGELYVLGSTSGKWGQGEEPRAATSFRIIAPPFRRGGEAGQAWTPSAW